MSQAIADNLLPSGAQWAGIFVAWFAGQILGASWSAASDARLMHQGIRDLAS